MHASKASKRFATLTAGVLAIVGFAAASSSAAVTPISLVKAKDFAVTTTGGIINTGTSTISGNLGLTQTISYLDTGSLTLKGDYHFGDVEALAAASDVNLAYSAAVSESPTVAILPELAGVTLTPGIYSSAAGFSNKGILTLDAQNNPNAIFVFQTPLALNTGASSKINIINGGQACNVNWQVGTTISLGASTDFKGNLLGKGNFVSAPGTVVSGRLLINGGNVSLNGTQISIPNCKKYDFSEKRNIANGGGSYLSTMGKANFNVQVSGTTVNGSYSNIGGNLTWNVDKAWKFKGNITTFNVDATGMANVSGTGSLSYYSRATTKSEGRWINAVVGTVQFNSRFTGEKRSDGTLGRLKTFAIGFTGSPVAGVPSLPILGSLVPITGGGGN